MIVLCYQVGSEAQQMSLGDTTLLEKSLACAIDAKQISMEKVQRKESSPIVIFRSHNWVGF